MLRPVTGIDWIIVGFTLLMAVWGYAQGLVVGLLSLVGFLGGGFLGSRLAPLLLSGGAHSPYSPLFALLGAFALGGILASILEIVGFRIRRYLRGPLGAADGIGGGGGGARARAAALRVPGGGGAAPPPGGRTPPRDPPPPAPPPPPHP